MKGLITLSKKEVHRARVLEHVAVGRMTLKEAAQFMRLSYRQTRRIHKRWRQIGLIGLCHGNRGRTVGHAIAPEQVSVILSLHDEVYRDFNDTHFTEALREREGITVSREKVRQILRSGGHGPKRKRRPKKGHRRRPRKTQLGLMMQWDGSPHHWFGPERPPCCLMSAIDDAETRVLGLLFVEAESSVAYLRLLDMVVRRHGIPLSVYQDRHSALVRTDDYWSIEEQLCGQQYPTHVGRVLQDLSIEAIRALSPQAKGRIERSFGIMQDRLIAELAYQGITDIETANPWLEEFYIEDYNRRFSVRATEPGSAFRKISARERYDRIAFAYEATVANDNCIRLGGLRIDVPATRKRPSHAKAKVIAKQHLDGRWTVHYKGQIIAKHPATPLTEPARSWKKRPAGGLQRGRSMTQVYINSKPAPLPTRGHNLVAVKGTY